MIAQERAFQSGKMIAARFGDHLRLVRMGHDPEVATGDAFENFCRSFGGWHAGGNVPAQAELMPCDDRRAIRN